MSYEELNRLKWTGKLPGAKITIIHRGAPDNQKLVLGGNITEIKKGHFMCLDDETGNETYIPMHRVLSIELEGKILWRKRGR